MGKQPVSKEENIFNLDPILHTKPIEQLQPESSIIHDIEEDEDLIGVKNEALIKNVGDTRKQIPDTKIYPYCCIGVITGKYEEFSYHGTGCLIASMIVLTCAHNIYHRGTKQAPTNLMFTPAMNGKKGRKPVKVKQCHYPKEYLTLEEKHSEYDFAVL